MTFKQKGAILLAHTAVAKKQSEPKMSRALVRQETIAGYLFLLPSLIFFIGFVIYPMVMCIFTSFFDSSMNRADVFIGLQNYVELFHDSVFLGALRNTLIIVVVSVPITCIFSLWVASAIVNMPPWATSLFRVIFYLPVVTGSVAVTVVWKWMFNNYYGIFNYLGKSMGLLDQNINWLGDTRYAQPASRRRSRNRTSTNPLRIWGASIWTSWRRTTESAKCRCLCRTSARTFSHLPGKTRRSWKPCCSTTAF